MKKLMQSPAGVAGAFAAPAYAEDYFPIISKGFQHQFWQAVKAGAAGGGQGRRREDHVRRAGNRGDGRQADRHALRRARQEAAGPRLRRAGLEGRDSAAEEGAGRAYPGDRLRLRRRQRHPARHLHDRQPQGRRRRRRPYGRADRRFRRGRARRARPDQQAPARTAATASSAEIKAKHPKDRRSSTSSTAPAIS